MRRFVWQSLMFSVLLVPVVVGPSFAQSAPDECLVEIHDQNGALPDGGSLCQNAVGKSCTFNLSLCLNEPEAGCTPATFQKKTFHAMGHCGPVRKLEVSAPPDTSPFCGGSTPIKVRTRGSHKGQCTIRAAVQTATKKARKDVDTVTLVCEPPSGTCPSTTTTTPTTSTTTTTAP